LPKADKRGINDINDAKKDILKSDPSMIRVTLLAGQNCVLSGLSAAIEFFNLCNLLLPHIHKEVRAPYFFTEIVTPDGRPVSSFGQIRIDPSRSIHEIQRTDLILIPSFQPSVDGVLDKATPLIEWIERHYRHNAKIGAISGGVLILAETGLLNGKIATTNWLFLRQFESRYPEVRLRPQQILTEECGLMCTASNNFTVDMCTYFIKQIGLDEMAAKFSKGLMLEPKWQHQSPWMIFDIQKKHNDSQILKAQLWMEKNFAGIASIDPIAEKTGISPRHFKRRFKRATGDSPLGYLQRLRVEAAKHLLETTEETVNEITWRVGYEDINSFRRLFKRLTGLCPKEYRQRFSQTADLYL